MSAIVVGCQGGLAAVAADEPAGEFLEGLRDRGDFEEALDYLEKAKTDPQVPAAFKETIDYEAGVTLIAWGQVAESASLRESRLNDAQKRLARFLAQHPKHALVNTAMMQSANVSVELARLLVEKASLETTSREESARLRKLARKQLLEAQDVFTELEARFVEEHKKFPKVIDVTRNDQIDARQRVRRDIVQCRLLLGAVAEEIAKTYAPGSAEHKKHLTEAVDRYGSVHDKYKMFLAGLYAHLFQARCLKGLGDTKEALRICDELLFQPDEPRAFRDLKTKAVLLAIQTHLLPEVKGYDKALKLGKGWIETAAADEESSADGLAIRYHAGTAALELAGSLPKKDAQWRELTTTGVSYLRFVARYEGEYQETARQWLDRHTIQSIDGERR